MSIISSLVVVVVLLNFRLWPRVFLVRYVMCWLCVQWNLSSVYIGFQNIDVSIRAVSFQYQTHFNISHLSERKENVRYVKYIHTIVSLISIHVNFKSINSTIGEQILWLTILILGYNTILYYKYYLIFNFKWQEVVIKSKQINKYYSDKNF